MGEPAGEAAPGSGEPVEGSAPPGVGSEAASDSDGQEDEAAPSSVEAKTAGEVPSLSAVPAAEALPAPRLASVPGSSMEGTPLASRLITMAAEASNFIKVSVCVSSILYCLLRFKLRHLGWL